MALDIKPILNAGVTAQAAGLAMYNVRTALKKRKTPKDLFELGVTNIVGTSLIQAEAGFIGGL